MAPFVLLGRFLLEFIQETGGVFILLWELFQVSPRIFKNIENTLYQMEKIGIGSIPLVLVTSLFVGAVTSVQAAYQFHGYVPLKFLGTVVGKSVTLELGPVLTALVVGGRVSASIAAELGTTADSIEARTGIVERRVARDGESASGLGADAGRRVFLGQAVGLLAGGDALGDLVAVLFVGLYHQAGVFVGEVAVAVRPATAVHRNTTREGPDTNPCPRQNAS